MAGSIAESSVVGEAVATMMYDRDGIIPRPSHHPAALLTNMAQKASTGNNNTS